MPCKVGHLGRGGQGLQRQAGMPGESPRLNKWYWPSLREARSRGCRRACFVQRNGAGQVAIDPGSDGDYEALLASLTWRHGPGPGR